MPSLFDRVPHSVEEVFETLHEAPGVRIERIVSHGQPSADGFWYDQPHAEWVLLVRGSATLRLLDPDEVITLAAGDHLLLGSRRRHRVEAVAADAIWLAVHLASEASTATRVQRVIQSTMVPATVEHIRRDLTALGVVPGMTLAVHSSLSACGYVVGGAAAVILALEQALGEAGTLAMPTHSMDLSDPSNWQDPAVPELWHELIRQNVPAYEPALTPTRGMGAIPECFRKQLGCRRSDHPLCSWAARGRDAEHITLDHALSMSQGESSPLARLYELDAHVLLIGVGYSSNTCCHLAEYRNRFAAHKACRRGAPIARGGRSAWVEFDDIYWYDADFELVGRDFESYTNAVRNGRVAQAESKLFSLRACVDHAVAWMNENRALP